MRPPDLDLDDLFSATYEELRRLAASIRRGESSETINTTALVNEAYLKLAAANRISATSRIHFKRIAARAMRQVLVEAARRRSARKRSSGCVIVTLDEGLDGMATRSDELIALDAALSALAQLNPRQARMVEYRFFGGLDVSETATLLCVSESTVLRDWRAAKAWLTLELRRAT